MSREIIKEWAQTDAWKDLMSMLEGRIDRQSRAALAKGRTSEVKYEIGVADGMAVALDILQRLRSNNAHSEEAAD